MEKLFAKVIKGRLQVVVEDTLPDSQCGFRRDQGCIDMIFCARQIMEKAREHNTKVFMLFVDLRKAYDSVPCQALWLVLEKYGIPPLLVRLIQSLHDGMKIEVSVDGATTPVIEVNNGLRQGCTIAPSLFNLYFNLVIEEWRRRCQPFGTEVLYKCGGKLVGERTRRPSHVLVTELQIADDAAIVGDSRESIVRAAEQLVEVLSEWGLTMSFPKTKLLVAGASCGEEDLQPIHIGGETIEAVSSFRYLGSVLESHGEIWMDVEDRVARASRAFGALCRPVFCNGSLSRKTKRMVYHAPVLGVLLYGAETWATKKVSTQNVEAFNNRYLWHIMNISRAEQRAGYISSVQMRRNSGMDEALEDVVIARRLRWLGHVARIQEDNIPKRLLLVWLTHQRPMHG